MRRITPAFIAMRMLMACLVILGMSNAAWSVSRCSVETCGTSCPMHQARVQPKLTTSCCPKKAASETKNMPQPKAGCKCRISAPRTTAQATAQLAEPPVQVFGPVPPIPWDLTLPVIDFPTNEILFHSDSSPPIVARHPDLGRAPPAA